MNVERALGTSPSQPAFAADGRLQLAGKDSMKLALLFLLLAVLAAVLGAVVTGLLAGLAQLAFFFFIVVFVIIMVIRLARGPR